MGRISIPESYAISHFINGLRPHVQKAVRLFMPQTLVHAYALARLQESSTPAREGFSQAPNESILVFLVENQINLTTLLYFLPLLHQKLRVDVI